MKKSTRILSALLAMVLLLGLMAGCQQNPVETNPPETTAPPAETTAPPAETTEPVEEAYTFPAGAELEIVCGHDINGLPLDGFVEEATGLNITWVPNGGQKDVLSASLTEKVTPSLMFYGDPAWGHEMGRYGAFVNLYDYKEILPDFFARYEAYGDEIKKDYETAEGELYSAPVFINGDVQIGGWVYREDIFAKHNLTAPTNWDEFVAVLDALKKAYPDSYPLTFRKLDGSMYILGDMAQQFGVDYAANSVQLDRETGTYYNSWTTDEARNLLKMFRFLITEGYMDVATLSNSTADWSADMASSKSFITFDKAFMLDSLEKAGQEVDPNYSLAWFTNVPMVQSDVPYYAHATKDYAYTWHVTTRCADVDLALRYLNWMYSEEGSEILSWGKEGESYGVDEAGNKYFLEGYDATYQARYADAGYIDFKATATTYTGKCQEFIFDVNEAAKAGGFYYPPTVVLNEEEQTVVNTYQVDFEVVKNSYWFNFLLGQKDIESDADWNEFKSACAAAGEADLIAAYNAAYARFIAE